MSIIQQSRRYPIDGPELTTKPNKQGRVVTFTASTFVYMGKKVVRVYGQSSNEMWCHVDFKFKHIPKWLHRGIKKHGKV